MSANTNPQPNPEKMQLRLAWQSVRKLINDPEDTSQVFAVIRAMSGPSLERGMTRFRAMDTGRRVLEQDIDLLDTLRDRDKLRALPAGSFGRAYLAFVEREAISADGLVDASEAGEETYANAKLARYGKRLRDQHDLWHVLTNYGRDELGELCLLAFTYAQTRNRGIGLIVLVGAYKFSQGIGTRVLRAARRGFRDGRRAAWLPGQDWEALLPRPLAEVRRELGIDEPIAYRALIQDLAAA
jgi:ubiquinone biosynthesis protein COQ4